ncbi:helix-turn-helix transcriptional regulator [Agrilutibacter solisilvae]|uniref:Helix-turn-helix transcriptional regulator n=1 Tax=Agrilutibacter solisilvae TaxID=2763317 RepID=A0A974Y3G0_9GAMM|nr:helix-turn-helix transcriptional regulator [Lysobacter solisilvae]QSX79800.1 helix-turn-helix transcriptional regulator [Lysobacter solisilvae]
MPAEFPRPVPLPEFHCLRSGTLDLAGLPRDRMHLVHVGGRGLRVDLPAGWMSVWIPLRGAPDIATPADAYRSPDDALPQWPLPTGRMLVARGDLLTARTRAPALCLLLAGTPAAWNALLRTLPGAPACGDIFARQWACARPLRRAAVRMAQCLRSATFATLDPPAGLSAQRVFALALVDAQRDLEPFVDRCNGRTPQRRRLTLQRLLRTHQLIERDPEARLELAQLARSANYSPWHLIRMYREVFGETPSEHAARLRLERAWSLVRDSAMPVCLITQHLGYESQSAFCRAFKNAFGLTTTQVRHLPVEVARLRSHAANHVRPRNAIAGTTRAARHAVS